MKMPRLLLVIIFVLSIVIAGLGIFPALALTTTPTPINPPSAMQTDSAVFIRSYRVDVEITNQIARTRIEQVFVNEGTRNAEGTYIFPLPLGVTVSDLVMRIDGQPYSARILEKEEAKQVYTDIVRQMRDPALLEYIGTNAIQANVFPIPPGGQRTLEIEYSQLLPVEQGLVHYVYPLRTDHVSHLPVGSLSIRVRVESNDPISSVYSPTHNVAVDRRGDKEFVAGFETTNTHETNDFSLYYGLASDEVNLNFLTYRESATEDGFFMALIAPPVQVDESRVIAKDVIVVLDQSGSMDGVKWEQARDAAQFVLENLNPADRFNVVVFSTGIKPFATRLQDSSESQEASQWLDTLIAEGGTNIDEALRTALEMNDKEHQVVILFLTDGLPTEGIVDLPAILDNVSARAADNVRFFTFGVGDDVNTFLLDEISQQFHGASAYVRPGEDINESVSTLYRKISAPVLTDLNLEFDGVMVYDVYPPLDQLPDLFIGSQLMVTGRYRREEENVTLRLSGKLEDESQGFTYENLSWRSNAGGDVLIPRLWATRRIGELLNMIRLQGESPELVDSIVRLSIRYGIITPYTSFIITEQDIFTQQDVAQASAMMQPTAVALALTPSGASAVNAAQQAGGMSQVALAPTMAPNTVYLVSTPPPTASPAQSATLSAHFGTPAPMTPTRAGTLAAGPQLTLPPSTPSPVALDPAGGVPASTVRSAGDRTFVWRDGVWIDTTYDPDEMTPRRIEFLSDEYFELLDQDERIAEYLALGDHVIFLLDDQAYEIVPQD
ncbi:MAG: VWA domain-containing protein [Chloroflexi bacterium]|nr:VWA domain-containing protein [Chloroflexota bacterium]